MRILVTGAEGMLGRAVVDRLANQHEVLGVDLHDGDLTDAAAVERLFARGLPQWVIHCAAWTDVDGAEGAPEAAMQINAGATENLLQACGKTGCGLTYISTDYVFMGEGEGYREEDSRHPLNHYGLTKASGEELVSDFTGPWQIVRTSWLFGDGKKNFVKTIGRLLGQAGPLRVVTDQRGNPTYAPDLADVLGFLVSGGHHGIFHVTNAGSCSWFEFAQEIARGSGADPGRILPSSSEFPRPARRPACSVLLSSRLEEMGCPPRPPWQDALKRYLKLLASGQARFP